MGQKLAGAERRSASFGWGVRPHKSRATPRLFFLLARYRALEVVMPKFNCLLIGQSNEVLEHETIEAEDEAVALAKIEHMIYQRPRATAVEIWAGGRLSLRLTRNELAHRHGLRDAAACPRSDEVPPRRQE